MPFLTNLERPSLVTTCKPILETKLLTVLLTTFLSSLTNIPERIHVGSNRRLVPNVIAAASNDIPAASWSATPDSNPSRYVPKPDCPAAGTDQLAVRSHRLPCCLMTVCLRGCLTISIPPSRPKNTPERTP